MMTVIKELLKNTDQSEGYSIKYTNYFIVEHTPFEFIILDCFHLNCFDQKMVASGAFHILVDNLFEGCYSKLTVRFAPNYFGKVIHLCHQRLLSQ